MNLKDVRTREHFNEYLRERMTIEDDNIVDVVNWFIAMVNARMFFDSYTTKDVARLLLDGTITPIVDNPHVVDEFFATFFEDADDALEANDKKSYETHANDAVNNLKNLLTAHFGKDYNW